MLRTYVFRLALLLVFLALAGCGSKSISINLREFSFSPTEIEMPAGEEVILSLKNLGSLDHNFHLMEAGYEVTDSWKEEDAAHVLVDFETVGGGEDVTYTFKAPPAPGEYQFVCSVPGHIQQGMRGTLTVVEP